MRKFFLKLFITNLLLALIILIGAFMYYNHQINQPINFDEEQIFSIKPGQSITSFSNQLVDAGYVKEPYSLQILARVNKTASQIKTGDYQFSQNMTLSQVLDKIVKGDVVSYRVTILEGWTFQQFRNAINKVENISHETKDLTDRQLLSALGLDISHPEGWFYPDTYFFSRSDSDLDIYRQAFDRMELELSKAWNNRSATSQEIKTPYEALTLASIIERETSVESELKKVSSVFHNRLKKGMRLQTDPTIIYGLGDKFDGNLKKSHLRDEANKYNTYVYGGLTPTPISMPSKASIEAALNPDDTDYFYFVATGNGGHKFSQNYDQHRQAIREYHKTLKSKQ